MKSPLNTTFDKIYCINLDKRKDRWNQINAQFKRHKIEVERFSAVKGNRDKWVSDKYICKQTSFNGAMGCIASHLDVIKMAKKNNYKSVLIIEDDCDFEMDFNNLFSLGLVDVPKDWDLLYLGGVHETREGVFVPVKITDRIVEAKRIITTTCYAIKNTIYDLVINTIEKDLPYPWTAIDGYLGAVIQPQCKTYAFHPPLVWQRSSFSDVQNGPRDYSIMMRKDNIQ